MENPDNRENTGRNEDGTFKQGVSGNPGGRPKNTLKDYDRYKFQNMTDEQKEEFLKTISNEIRYKMAEGNPATSSEIDLTSKGKQIFNADKQLNKIYGENGADSV